MSGIERKNRTSPVADNQPTSGKNQARASGAAADIKQTPLLYRIVERVTDALNIGLRKQGESKELMQRHLNHATKANELFYNNDIDTITRADGTVVTIKQAMAELSSFDKPYADTLAFKLGSFVYENTNPVNKNQLLKEDAIAIMKLYFVGCLNKDMPFPISSEIEVRMNELSSHYGDGRTKNEKLKIELTKLGILTDHQIDTFVKVCEKNNSTTFSFKDLAPTDEDDIYIVHDMINALDDKTRADIETRVNSTEAPPKTAERNALSQAIGKFGFTNGKVKDNAELSGYLSTKLETPQMLAIGVARGALSKKAATGIFEIYQGTTANAKILIGASVVAAGLVAVGIILTAPISLAIGIALAVVVATVYTAYIMRAYYETNNDEVIATLSKTDSMMANDQDQAARDAAQEANKASYQATVEGRSLVHNFSYYVFMVANGLLTAKAAVE